MRAFAVDEFGAEGSVHDLPVPELGEGQVRVRVHAAAVNVMDPIFTSGVMKDRMEHCIPLVPGIDLSGVVDRVAPGVDSFAAGDEVYGVSSKPFLGAGTFAELVVVSASDVAPKPRTLDLTAAATVPHVGLTALAAVEAADPQPGQVLALVGATGGVGSFVSQLVGSLGATVVAVISGSGAEQALAYGASETVDYQIGPIADQVLALHPDGVDALVDLHSSSPDDLAANAAAVRPGGVAISPLGSTADAAEELAERGVTYKRVQRELLSRLPELTALIESGKLRVPRLRTFPLEDAGAAIAEMAGGHVRGKLVITIN